MTVALLAQAYRLEEFQRAVRDQFARGGSLRNFLILWGTAIAFVVFCRVLWRLQQRITGGVERNDPRKLFAVAQKRLGLTVAEQRCLRSIVRAAPLEHPTAILLSPVLFEEAAEVWRKRRGASASGRDHEKALLTNLRRNLFPS